MNDKSNNDGFFRWVSLILIVWYLCSCAMHYFSHRSLWNDELAVLESIRLMKPAELFREPLRVSQAFPHFYLFCIQSFAKLFGNSIEGLRFFPFVCMLLAFGVWLRVARNEFKDPSAYLSFILCWVASVPLIYYSAELKQYSMDVLVSGLFVLFLSYQEQLSRPSNARFYGFILAALPAAVLFSYPAYFFLIFPLWNLCRGYKEDRSQLKWIILYGCSMIIFISLSYQFDIRLRPTKDVTQGFNDYFISLKNMGEFFQTFGEGVNNLFSRWFVELPKIFRKLARVFMLFGLVYMFVSFFTGIKKSQWKFCSVSAVALVVFFELALAAANYKYPFGVPRTALFLCPMLLILTIQGIRSVKNLNAYAYYGIHGAFVVYLMVVAVGVAKIVMTQPLIAIPTIWTL